MEGTFCVIFGVYFQACVYVCIYLFTNITSFTTVFLCLSGCLLVSWVNIVLYSCIYPNCLSLSLSPPIPPLPSPPTLSLFLSFVSVSSPSMFLLPVLSHFSFIWWGSGQTKSMRLSSYHFLLQINGHVQCEGVSARAKPSFLDRKLCASSLFLTLNIVHPSFHISTLSLLPCCSSIPISIQSRFYLKCAFCPSLLPFKFPHLPSFPPFYPSGIPSFLLNFHVFHPSQPAIIHLSSLPPSVPACLPSCLPAADKGWTDRKAREYPINQGWNATAS